MRYSTFLYSYWIGLHVHFKKAILHLKRAKGVFIFFGDCITLLICAAIHTQSYTICCVKMILCSGLLTKF